MPLPLLPLGIMALIGTSAWAGKKHLDKKKYTPERKMIFETAMEKVKDAGKLNQLADKFAEQGLKAQATLLRKRAKLRALPEPVKAERREAMRKAFLCKAPDKLLKFADILDAETAYANAAKIRAYAKTLAPVDSSINHGV
jgi:hypothetical protein